MGHHRIDSDRRSDAARCPLRSSLKMSVDSLLSECGKCNTLSPAVFSMCNNGCPCPSAPVSPSKWDERRRRLPVFLFVSTVSVLATNPFLFIQSAPMPEHLPSAVSAWLERILQCTRCKTFALLSRDGWISLLLSTALRSVGLFCVLISPIFIMFVNFRVLSMCVCVRISAVLGHL